MIGSKTDKHRESELKRMQVWGISGCQSGKTSWRQKRVGILKATKLRAKKPSQIIMDKGNNLKAYLRISLLEVRTEMVKVSKTGVGGREPGVGDVVFFLPRNHSTTNNQLEVEQSVFPSVLLWPAACDLTGASRSKTGAKTEMGTFKQVRGRFCWHSKPCSELLVLSHPQLPLPVLLSLRKDLNTHPFNSFAKQ